FHLQRHGVPCARLLAFGQRLRPFAPARSFLLTEAAPDAVLLSDWLALYPGWADTARDAAEVLLRQLHAARCHFHSPGHPRAALVVRDGSAGPAVAVGRVDGVRQ